MLNYKNAFSSFAVDDINKAKNFYSKKLGLKVEEDPMGFLEISVSGSKIVIYPKPNHIAATFTVLNFLVIDIEKTVKDLTEDGISLEQYPELQTDKDGISRGSGPLIAWFKDPSGNILSIIEKQ